MRRILKRCSAVLAAVFLAMALMLSMAAGAFAGEEGAAANESLMSAAKSQTEAIINASDEDINYYIENGSGYQKEVMTAWKEAKAAYGPAKADQSGAGEPYVEGGDDDTCVIRYPVSLENGNVCFSYTVDAATGSLNSMTLAENTAAIKPEADEKESPEEAAEETAEGSAESEEAPSGETAEAAEAEEPEKSAGSAESEETASPEQFREGSEEVVVEEKESLGSTFVHAILNTLMGLCTVFLVLLFLSFIISLFKRLPNFDKKKAPAAEARTAPAQAAAVETEEIPDDEELVAVITAAIMAAREAEGGASAGGDGFVVRSIRKARRR